MIKKIFYGYPGHYGDGTVPMGTAVNSAIVEENENTLNISTFDVESLSSISLKRLTNIKKVDILFYNRVNERGRVVSSVVYLSEVKDSDDVSSIFYRPRYLYKNSSVELGMDLSNVTDYSYFNYLRFPDEQQPYFAPRKINQLPISGKPSPIVMDKYVLLDGWYTLVSAGVHYSPENDNLVSMMKGGLIIPNSVFITSSSGGGGSTMAPVVATNSNVLVAVVDYPTQSKATDWHDITTFDTSGKAVTDKGSLLGVYLDESRPAGPSSNWYPAYAKQDFFVMSNFGTVYKKLLKEYVDNSTAYNMAYEQMKYKHRPIQALAAERNFKEAQLYLQSTEYVRLEHTEL